VRSRGSPAEYFEIPFLVIQPKLDLALQIVHSAVVVF
jgi:hypothetical protein